MLAQYLPWEVLVLFVWDEELLLLLPEVALLDETEDEDAFEDESVAGVSLFLQAATLRMRTRSNARRRRTFVRSGCFFMMNTSLFVK